MFLLVFFGLSTIPFVFLLAAWYLTRGQTLASQIICVGLSTLLSLPTGIACGISASVGWSYALAGTHNPGWAVILAGLTSAWLFCMATWTIGSVAALLRKGFGAA